MVIYLIGSLRNPQVREVADKLRARGHEVFDDWHAAGEKADEEWMRYEQERGHTYLEALKGHAAQHTFAYDKHHIGRSDVGVLVMPAGKSGHLELGYMLGQGKRGYIYMPEEPERWDVMTLFATAITNNLTDLFYMIEGNKL